jgi:hypothetical protein
MHQLQKILEDAEFETRSYSGRGMTGKTCLAVYASPNAVFCVVLTAILERGVDVGGGADDAGTVDVESLHAAFKRMASDAMGTGSIVYFPNVQFEEAIPNLDAMGADELNEWRVEYAKNHDAYGAPVQYAKHKARAITARLAGEIALAELHENTCDSLYKRLPEGARW